MEIAARILTLRDGNNNVDIPIRIFAPKKQGVSAWSCHYEIGWPEGVEARDAWGINSLQAILLTLQAIGADIYTSAYHKSGHLFHEVPGRGYGFPVPASLRDVLVGDDATFL